MRSKSTAILILSILVAVVFTSLALGVGSATKPPKPPKAPKTAAVVILPAQAAVCPVAEVVIVDPPEIAVVNPVAVVTVSDTEVITVFTDLTPGDRYAFTFTIHGSDGIPTFIGGDDAIKVGVNGTRTIRIDIADLVDWESNLSHVVMSLRPVGSRVTAVSNNAAGEPLTITQSFVV